MTGAVTVAAMGVAVGAGAEEDCVAPASGSAFHSAQAGIPRPGFLLTRERLVACVVHISSFVIIFRVSSLQFRLAHEVWAWREMPDRHISEIR